MNHAPFLTFIKDEAGRFLFYNQKMAERFGISLQAWLGKNDFEIWPEAIARIMHANDVEVITGGRPIERMEETLDERGAVTTWKVHKFAWQNARGQVLLGGIGMDMSEELLREKALAAANLQLVKLARIDSLTGLANRRVLDEQVEYEFRMARRHNVPMAVVLMDLDNFKRRNDQHGHASGDDVLRRLGFLVNSTLRATDLAARYGGEEIVILLPGAGSEGARIFSERLRESMRLEDWPHEPVTASFGTASLEEATPSGRSLIALADRAMYEAKRAGKDRVVDYRDVQKTTI